MSDIEPHKLKVTELRDELKKRGLDTKGKKEHLVKRLLQALGMDDAGADDSQANVEDSDVSQLCDTSVTAGDVTAVGDGSDGQHAVDTVAANGDDSVATAAAAHIDEPVTAEPPGADRAGSVTEETATDLAVSAKPPTPTDDASAEREAADLAGDGCTSQSAVESAAQQSGQAADALPADSETDVDMAAAAESPSEPTTGSAQYTLPASESGGASISSSQQSTEEAAPAAAEDSATAAAAATQVDLVAAGDMTTAEDVGKATSASASGDGEAVAAFASEPGVKMEQDEVAPVPAQENPPANVLNSDVAVEGSSHKDAADKDTKEEALQKNGSDDQLPASRGRSRSRSPVQQRPRSPQLASSADDESWMLSDEVQLDRYNSDLNMIMKDNYTAVPLCQAGFAYMWAGAKATYGVTSGKVAFEFKVTDEPRVDLPADEKFPNVARIGWSTDSGSMQLGEDNTSWGYGGTGKASHENSFKDYGQSFAKGDVITAYLDVGSSPVVISFSKNGDDLGVAFEIEKSVLKDQALFPTILSKNTEFTVNFGQKEAAFPLREGYTFIGQVPSEQRVRACLPPAKKSDAEVLMLIGLPGAGKTYWAAKQCQAHPEKRYNVLGTNAIIDKMKVMNLQRKYNYTGRWDVLFDRSNQCLSKLIDLASSKRRNYIIDQTNVYGTAQKRKMRPFEGFRRKAVIVVPSDDEFLSRTVKRIKEEAKEVPDDAVLEMKANFSIPSVGEVFDEVIFPELPEADARKLVAQYVKEGQVKFPPGARRFNDRRSGPEQQSGSGTRDAGRGRGYAGPRDGFRNDKPGYGGNYRSGGGSGSNGGSAGFGNNRYEDRNSRPERGYHAMQSPSAGSRGFPSGQNPPYGGGGSYSAPTKPYNAPSQPVQPPGGSWAGGAGRPNAPASGSSGPQPAGHWGTGWNGGQPQQAAWGNNYGANSGGTGASGPVGQAGSYGSGFRGQAASYSTQSGDYSSRSAGLVTQPGGYGAPPSGSYSAPPSGGYNAPPSGGYGAPPSGGYGATPSGGYGAPPSGGYGAPPSGGYGAPPSGGYGAQASSYGAQASSYSAQSGGYGTQSGGYGTQASGVGSQPGGYDTQSRGYGAQAGSYGTQARTYGQGAYSSPAGSYNNQAGNYGSQAGSSSSQGRSYGQGQGTSGSWPAQQQSLPPSRPQATSTPQWGQQQASGAHSWQQSSYGQRR